MICLFATHIANGRNSVILREVFKVSRVVKVQSFAELGGSWWWWSEGGSVKKTALTTLETLSTSLTYAESI